LLNGGTMLTPIALLPPARSPDRDGRSIFFVAGR
jgi:hypothetical protein